MFGKLFQKTDYPEFWQQYVELMRRPLPGKTPLREVPFAVFDTETTGLNPPKDKLLSIGGVKVLGGEIDVAESLELLLEQDVAPAQEDIAIHGIIPAVNDKQAGMAEALRRFVQWCGPCVLAGHHVAFDIAMINAALQQHGCGKLRNRSVDTIQLSVRVSGRKEFNAPGALGLDALASQYHIPAHDRHTAAGDAFITGILLLKLLNRLERRGVHTLGQLLGYRSM